jgi:hypothetical protein
MRALRYGPLAGKWIWLGSLPALASIIGVALPLDPVRTVSILGALVVCGLLAAMVRSGTGAGLAMLLLSAVILPLEVSRGESVVSASAPLAAMICAAWLLRLVFVRRQISLDACPSVVAVLVFMAIAALSFLAGQFPWFPVVGAPMRAQLGGLAIFLLSGGVFLLVAHEVASVAALQGLTWLFVIAGAAAVTVMVVPGLDVNLGGLALTTQQSAGSLFFTWLVAVSVSQAVWNRDLSPAARLLLMAVGAVTVSRGLFLAFSWVSGWLPPVVVLGTIMVLRFPRLAFASAAMLAVPVLLVAGTTWDSIMAGESYSWSTRIEALSVMWKVAERNLWLGLGPANYHFYTPLFPFLGYPARFSSHNNYVDLLVQTGAIGLVVFVWFCAEAFRLASRLLARLPDGFGKAYAAGTLAGLLGSLVAGFLADWIVPFVYNIGLKGFRSSLLFWFFLGGLVALRRLTRRRSVTAPGPGGLPLRRHATLCT